MGQPIVVVEKPSAANPGVVRFETNRALSGMGHERYRVGEEVRGDRPTDELARRLLDRGGIDAVHVNGSIVTIDLEKGHDAAGVREIIEGLYIHYPDEATTDEGTADEGEATEGEATEGEVTGTDEVTADVASEGEAAPAEADVPTDTEAAADESAPGGGGGDTG